MNKKFEKVIFKKQLYKYNIIVFNIRLSFNFFKFLFI